MEELRIIHDSQNMKFRSPFGAVKVGEKVNLEIEINKSVTVSVEIIQADGNTKNIGMNKEYLNNDLYKYSVLIDTSDYIGVLEYYFIVGYEHGRVYYGNNEERLGGIGRVYNHNPVPYQITVYEKTIVPNWYKEGVIYQIFVDRFFNGNKDGKINSPKKNSFIYGTWNDSPMYIKDNLGRLVRWDFYGGNLKGITEKLDYLKKLGISIIYLNPIFKAASCHKYDTGDYEIVDEMFGTNEEFKILCQKAKERGIRIILDGVFSHTGDDSKYFNKFGNYQTIGACQSTNSPYYRWYRFADYPHTYECWWGIDNQPNVNEMEPSYIEYIIKGENSIIKKWMELGASGWRLDVADELPDEFIVMIKEKMNEVYSDNVLIGEVWEDASNKISYSKRRHYLYGKELDSITNYPLRDSLINFVKGHMKSDKFSKKVMSLFENYPKENFYANMNIIGTHDTERILTILDKKIELLKIIIALQMTLPGVPLVYYGDEAGLEGGKDPENRKAYPWGRENKEILDFYKLIIGIRNKENALKKGGLRFYSTDLDVCAFERYYENEKIIVLTNTKGSRITLQNINIEGSYIDILDQDKRYKGIELNNALVLEGYDIKVLKCDK
ncbi:glycoside hydrolase family 13 protein [Clostridium sp. SHJSY1]|uniref:glycoside hydrolase family 13 protein n=1 Tax=Clostridium sp. SHJSY1 TaxID=2942483 RepID=UPI002874DEED|nr:glycoside hydrolase family 13 protein [Clostridium sp. SHJSY1]MDS0528465.1 glycoside hydrolase family 13 protein [Clostridium sp. SHJSY1]